MINEEEKFDDLLKTKLSDRDFFFDELNWDKANEAIENDEKKRKRRRFAIIFLSGLIVGIAFTFSMMSLFNSTTDKKLDSLNTPGPTTSLPNQFTTSASNSATNTAGKAGNTAQNTVAASPVASNENKTKAAKEKNKIYAEVTHNLSANSSPVIANAAVKKHHSRKNLSNNIVVLNNTRPANPSIRNTRSFANNKATNKPIEESAPSNNLTATITSPATVNSSITKETTINKVIAENNTQQSANINSTAQQSPTNNSVDQPAKTNEVPASAVVKADSGSTKYSNLTAQIDSKKAPDSLHIDSTKPVTAPHPKVPKRLKASNMLSIDGGLGCSFGWKSNGISEGVGLNPILGISFTHFIGKKIAFLAGMQYNSLTNLKTSYTNSITTYDFGFKESGTTITPKVIHYVSFPIMAQYYINDNNAICLGASVSFLINTSSTVTDFSQDQLNASPINHSKTEIGYTDGFNNKDIQARAAYRRRIYKSFSFTAEGYFGFLDIEENSFFSINTFQRNTGLRLMLSYDLIK